MAERRRAGRTRRAHREHGAPSAEPSGERVRGAVVERTHRVARPAARREGALELADTAERGAEDHCHPRGLGGDRRTSEQVRGRGEQELRGPTSHAARAGHRAKLLDLAPAPDPEIVDREALDHRDAVAAGDEPRPERVEVSAERGHDSRGDEADGLSALARHCGHRGA